MNDNYDVPLPDLDDLDKTSTAQQGVYPINAEAAWMLQLIQVNLDKTKLPDEIKNRIVSDMTPLITNASMTKMTRGEVRLFLGMFEEQWMKYKIYVFRKKFARELAYAKTLLMTLFMQNYNKSIEGWQGDHVFERKIDYKIKQTQQVEDFGDKVKGFFHKKQKNVEEGGY